MHCIGLIKGVVIPHIALEYGSHHELHPAIRKNALDLFRLVQSNFINEFLYF